MEPSCTDVVASGWSSSQSLMICAAVDPSSPTRAAWMARYTALAVGTFASVLEEEMALTMFAEENLAFSSGIASRSFAQTVMQSCSNFAFISSAGRFGLSSRFPIVCGKTGRLVISLI